VPAGELLAECDVVSLHLPLTPATRGLFDAGRLARMKSVRCWSTPAGARWSTSRRCPGLRLVGDDLIATHLDRLDRAAGSGAASAVLTKVNQIGTVTEARSRSARWSARSGWPSTTGCSGSSARSRHRPTQGCYRSAREIRVP
jgi:hypothetical protein